jgi:hypothetical protein
VGTIVIDLGDKQAMADAIINLFRDERRQADLA